MILYEAKYPVFSFSIKKSGVLEIGTYSLRIGKQNWIVNNSMLTEAKIDDFFAGEEIMFMSKKYVAFDYIEISATEYTKHRLCVTLFNKDVNVLSGNCNFLPLSNLKVILDTNNILISEKQVKYLQSLANSFSKKWKFENYVFDL
jgi:hypothetical protein